MADIELYNGQRQAYNIADGTRVFLSTRAIIALTPGVDLVVVPRLLGTFYDLPLELLDNLLTPLTVRELEGVCGM